MCDEEKLALRAEGDGESTLAMSSHERTESKNSIVSVASTDSYPCWPCSFTVSIKVVAREAIDPRDSKFLHLCPDHEIEVAAELLRWNL